MENEESLNVIPKIIHYCWFGGNKKTELFNKCIESWKRYMPDYEIMEWNEDNCNVYENSFVQQAYVKKKWAFVADYFRFKALKEYGGIYLDTDVEIHTSPENMLKHKMFIGFETRELINGAVMGSVPNHLFLKQAIEHYNSDNLISMRGYCKLSTLPQVIKHIFNKHNYKVQYNGEEQVVGDGIHIYPTNVVCINVFDGRNVFEHHFDASWWDVNPKKSYKYHVLKDFFDGLKEAEKC